MNRESNFGTLFMHMYVWD